ncbi:MAG TPA: DUF6807 family protein, partial [Pedobacter sp.]|uniref:DUF6807 family protein n=1 Tax=Pedobacter sp. TaxID=1411316 RepID=UPI002CAA3E51
MLKSILLFITLLFLLWAVPKYLTGSKNDDVALEVHQDEKSGTISVLKADSKAIILTQNAGENFRPYIHPIAAPDGKGILTEFSPEHHKHQTGLYWGLTSVNGRNYFANPGNGYWKR